MSTSAGRPERSWYNQPLSEDIKRNARCNDDKTIEWLFTTACYDSFEGRQAARFLLQLYAGSEGGSSALMQQLGRDSLRLWDIVAARNEKHSSGDRWEIPPEILVMAGFEAKSGSQQRDDIVQELKREAMFCLSIEENEVDASLFAQNRMITGAELDAVAARLNTEVQVKQFGDARKVTTEGLTAARPEPSLCTSFQLTGDMAMGASSGRFMPLLMDDHWVLFGVVREAPGTNVPEANNALNKNAVVFSSLELKPHQSDYLEALAEATTGRNGSLLVISEDLQKFAPNACGLFVARAMESIVEHGQKTGNSPISALNQLIDSYQTLNSEEKYLFNRNRRAELYGEVILQRMRQPAN